jgi:hypothetical protein
MSRTEQLTVVEEYLIQTLRWIRRYTPSAKAECLVYERMITARARGHRARRRKLTPEVQDAGDLSDVGADVSAARLDAGDVVPVAGASELPGGGNGVDVVDAGQVVCGNGTGQAPVFAGSGHDAAGG